MVDEKPDRVKGFALDTLAEAVDKITGVIRIKTLKPNDSFVAITFDESEYDIFVIDPEANKIRVMGGYFTETTECVLSGATLGGSMLWLGQVAVGMCMEFSVAGQTVTTSPVKIIGWRIEHFVVTKH